MSFGGVSNCGVLSEHNLCFFHLIPCVMNTQSCIKVPQQDLVLTIGIILTLVNSTLRFHFYPGSADQSRLNPQAEIEMEERGSERIQWSKIVNQF